MIDDSASPMQPSPLDLAVLSDELKLLWRLLAALDPPKREVLILAELEERSAPEIAECRDPGSIRLLRLRIARQEFNELVARARPERKRGNGSRADSTPEAAALMRSGRASFRPDASDRERVLRSLGRSLGEAAVDGAPSAAPGNVAAQLSWGWGKLLGGLAVLGVGGERSSPPVSRRERPRRSWRDHGSSRDSRRNRDRGDISRGGDRARVGTCARRARAGYAGCSAVPHAGRGTANRRPTRSPRRFASFRARSSS